MDLGILRYASTPSRRNEWIGVMGQEEGPRNHVLNMGPAPPCNEANFIGGKGKVQGNILGECSMGPAKTTERIKLLFGVVSAVDLRNGVLDKGPNSQ